MERDEVENRGESDQEYPDSKRHVTLPRVPEFHQSGDQQSRPQDEAGCAYPVGRLEQPLDVRQDRLKIEADRGNRLPDPLISPRNPGRPGERGREQLPYLGSEI